MRVLSLMGAIRMLSPAESEGMIQVSMSCLNSALASFGMLPEKSTKMTVSVPRAAVAFAEGRTSRRQEKPLHDQGKNPSGPPEWE